eukprot:TRINITY_DN5897_c0_g1_i1.p1 TRINITY_DN5897_c0_g1~~TRINITY_DN5897_c0_g1_i1.p1  ORF type:complete len:444 (+),score=103.71 TRINITY_DN5897_c0_g1_i1:106-1437(+)
MSDDEYAFEEEEEFVADDDCGGGCDDGDELESVYYDAKDKIDDDPVGAEQGLRDLLERDGGKTKWSWRAYKRLVKVYSMLRRFDEMKGAYRNLLAYTWDGRTRNDTEKAINKMLDLAANSGSVVVSQMYDITVEFVGEGGSLRNEKLWFWIKMRSAQVLFNTKEYDKCQQALMELKASCKEAGSDKWDRKKGTQLMTIFATEIQLCQETKSTKKLKAIYEAAMNVEGAIPAPKVMGIIREAGGKMYMEQGEYKKANEAFFQAFKNYDEAGHPSRIQCLKYLVLANMMSQSKINPFDSQEAKPYKTDPEIEAMTGLIDAASRSDIKAFEKILKENSKVITEDPFIDKYLSPLLRTVRTQVMQMHTRAYTSIKLSYLAEDLNISVKEVEELLVSMLLDGDLAGSVDQVRGVLILGDSSKGAARYKALQKWTEQLSLIQSSIGNRL